MEREIQTNKEPVSIFLTVNVPQPSKVRIACVDPYKKSTFYTDRWSNVSSSGEFEIRMPQSPDKSLLLVQNLTYPDKIKLSDVKQTKLKQYLPCVTSSIKIKPFLVKSFLKFARQFAENASILDVGTFYSDDGRFRIEYLPSIYDEGRELNTPARISNTNGVMEISKKHFFKYTVPMRMAILLHEFSHFNLNIVQKDEIEADLNALKIYMGLSYPTIEAHKSFLHVFRKSPSDQNKERYEYLKAFIDNFDKLKYRIC
jgi:hypothetical protein